jgi:hypothetical protein
MNYITNAELIKKRNESVLFLFFDRSKNDVESKYRNNDYFCIDKENSGIKDKMTNEHCGHFDPLPRSIYPTSLKRIRGNTEKLKNLFKRIKLEPSWEDVDLNNLSSSYKNF